MKNMHPKLNFHSQWASLEALYLTSLCLFHPQEKMDGKGRIPSLFNGNTEY